MIKIKDIEEAKLLNCILQEMILHKTRFEQIPHDLNIDYNYYLSLIGRIVEYNDNEEEIIRYNKSKDYYSFSETYETKEFLNKGGFEQIYRELLNDNEVQSYVSSLEMKNLQLQNDALEYQKQLREQEQRIRNLQEKDLKLSIWQMYWWVISTLAGILGFMIKLMIE